MTSQETQPFYLFYRFPYNPNPNLDHYLSLRTSRVPSFTYNQNTLPLPPSLSMTVAFTSPEGLPLTSYWGSGSGKYIPFKTTYYIPQDASTASNTHSIYRGVLATYTVSIDQPAQRLSSLPIKFDNPSRLVTSTPKKYIPALALALALARETVSTLSLNLPQRGANYTNTQTLHKFTQNPTHSKAPPYLTHTELRPP